MTEKHGFSLNILLLRCYFFLFYRAFSLSLLSAFDVVAYSIFSFTFISPLPLLFLSFMTEKRSGMDKLTHEEPEYLLAHVFSIPFFPLPLHIFIGHNCLVLSNLFMSDDDGNLTRYRYRYAIYPAQLQHKS